MIEQWLPDRPLLSPPPSEQSDAQDDQEPVGCPVCRRSDRIEKASGAVRVGSGLVLAPGASLGQPFVSELVMALAPPEPPRYLSYAKAARTTLWGWLFGALTYGLIRALEAQALVSIPQAPLDTAVLVTIAWFGIAIPVMVFGRALIDHRVAGKKWPSWQAAFDRWSQVFYCARDDVVFLPREQVVATPESMSNLLYRSPVTASAAGGAE